MTPIPPDSLRAAIDFFKNEDNGSQTVIILQAARLYAASQSAVEVDLEAIIKKVHKAAEQWPYEKGRIQKSSVEWTLRYLASQNLIAARKDSSGDPSAKYRPMDDKATRKDAPLEHRTDAPQAKDAGGEG